LATITPEPIFTPTPDLKSELSHYGLIAYTVNVDGIEDIFTINANGSNQTNITNIPARDILPAWSPDGKYVAKVISYLTPNFTTEEDIYFFDIQRSLKDPSLQPIRLTTDRATKNWDPVWQPVP